MLYLEQREVPLGCNVLSVYFCLQEAYISRTLYICKLPPDFTEAQINEVLAAYGDIRKITCYPSRQIAFAEFVCNLWSSLYVTVFLLVFSRRSGIYAMHKKHGMV